MDVCTKSNIQPDPLYYSILGDRQLRRVVLCHVRQESVKRPALQQGNTCLLGSWWIRLLVLKHNCYNFPRVITWLISPCLLSLPVIISLVRQSISSNFELPNLKWNNFSMGLILLKFFACRTYFSLIVPQQKSDFSAHVKLLSFISKYCSVTGLFQLSGWNCKINSYHPLTEVLKQP